LRGVTGISDVVIVSRPGVLANRTSSARERGALT